jgi:chemotaxis protein methyltransferase CheR
MLSDGEFHRLLEYLDRPWAGFRKVRKGVKKRVRRHMQSLGCATIEEYIGRLQQDHFLRSVCEAHLLVTISRFFRDRALWDHLHARILPELMDRFPGDLKAWSAGCASGEEPYTLALLWKDLTADLFSSQNLHILATDADPACLQRAQSGCYSPASLKEVPQHCKTRWFLRKPGSRQWQVDPALKDLITWQHHQLLGPPPPGQYQIILLRNNLLTYYQGQRLNTALTGILAALPAGGILILGSHERLPSSNLPLRRDPNCPWVYHALTGTKGQNFEGVKTQWDGG